MDVDVFFRDYSPNAIRKAMAEACGQAWDASQFNDCSFMFTVLRPRTGRIFHIESRWLAERLSRSPIYVVADSDCLIMGTDFITRGLDIFSRHPEYGLLSATSLCDGHFPAGIPTPPEEVVEMQAGGIAFVRKGILSEFRDCRPDEVDDVICSEMNRKGYKTGVMPSVRFNHLGCGYSIYQRFATPPSKQSV